MDAEGIGIWHGLGSRTLHCSDTCSSADHSDGSPSTFCALTKSLMAALLVNSPGSNVEEEGPDLTGDSDWGKYEGMWGVEAAGGSVGWVLSA